MVGKAIQEFERGELLHSVATCNICFETRPVFHATQPLTKSIPKPVSVIPWVITKDGSFKRCHKDKLSRKSNKKSCIKPAKFSGCLSDESSKGPSTNILRTNNMHFMDIPPYLQNLSTVEMALISRITVIMNVHILRYGMLASKGHCISLPQETKIANHLPLLAEEVGIVILKRKGENQALRQYSVKRKTVEEALKGLCFGFPPGGSYTEKEGYSLYLGPNHSMMTLKGRYIEHCPNPKEVMIKEERLRLLPVCRDQLPGLRVIEVPHLLAEEDKGPAPSQSVLAYDPEDESTT
jgi:hypothetical protein